MNHRGPHVLATLIFAGILLSAGGLQLGVEQRRGEKPQLLELFTQTPTVAHLRAYEQDLEDASWLARQLRPWMQYAQYVLLKDAGDKALRGPNGWFFYKPGVQYLTERKPTRSNSEDPATVICDFRDQLAERGIRLIVVPAPNKESVYPEQLSPRAARLPISICTQTESLLQRLEAAEVEVVNLFELFAHEKSAVSSASKSRLYLTQDSHWSPTGLELAARAIAQRIVERGRIELGRTRYHTTPAQTERLGDVVRMLNVPPIEKRLQPEQVLCARVVHPETNQPYQDDPQAEILVLGDSFLRIFQQDEPGSAGFIAHLARQLRQPVASIVNDGGASTLVRQELHRRPTLLKNKKVVIWEFVERDIRFGTEGWQRVPLPTSKSKLGSDETDD
jgi:hypothetical protein